MRFIFLLISILAVSAAVSAQTGRRAENFTASNMDGKTVELSSLKGKVVLLTFWSTRCPICHSEIPKLNQMAAAYAKADVVFLGATTDNEQKVRSFVEYRPFDFNILPNSFGLLLKYAAKDGQGNINMGYPAYFLIDRDGSVRYEANGWDKTKPLASAIDRLVAK